MGADTNGGSFGEGAAGALPADHGCHGRAGRAQARVEAERAATLVPQDRVARELTRIDGVLAQIAQARRQAAGGLLCGTARRSGASRPPPGARPPIGITLATVAATVRGFVEEHSDRIALHLAGSWRSSCCFWWARSRARQLPAPEGSATSPAIALDQPVAAALVLGMLAAFWIYAEEPRTARLIVEIGVFPPMVLILRQLVTPPMRPALYVMAAFFPVDVVRDVLVQRPVLERALFLLEMLAAAALLSWFIRSGRLDELIVASGGSASARVRKDLFKLALTGVLVALVADIVGNVSLARLIGSGVLSSGYLAMVLIAGRRLAEGLVTFTLRVRPLVRLRMVANHGAHLERRLSDGCACSARSCGLSRRSTTSACHAVRRACSTGPRCSASRSGRSVSRSEISWRSC
jgi:hypothetical protein